MVLRKREVLWIARWTIDDDSRILNLVASLTLKRWSMTTLSPTPTKKKERERERISLYRSHVVFSCKLLHLGLRFSWVVLMVLCQKQFPKKKSCHKSTISSSLNRKLNGKDQKSN